MKTPLTSGPHAKNLPSFGPIDNLFTTYQKIPSETEIENNPDFKNKSSFDQFYFFGTDKLSLKKGRFVQIFITQSEDFYLIENEEFDIFSHGNSKQEVIQNFKDLINYYFDFYKKLDLKPNMKEAKRLKDNFEKSFSLNQ